MWDTVVIGTVNPGFSTDIVNFDFNGDWHISHNKTCFWINNIVPETGAGMSIFKDTPAGERVAKLLKDKVPAYILFDELQTMFFANAAPGVLIALFKVTYEKGFAAGAREKLVEIRKVLGVPS